MLASLIATCDSDMWKHLLCDIKREAAGRRMDSKSILRWPNVTKTEYTPLDVHLQR